MTDEKDESTFKIKLPPGAKVLEFRPIKKADPAEEIIKLRKALTGGQGEARIGISLSDAQELCTTLSMILGGIGSLLQNDVRARLTSIKDNLECQIQESS